MEILIAGGTGFIGQSLVEHWADKQVTILGRQEQKILDTFGNQVKPLTWADFKSQPTHYLNQFDAVVNLCGEYIGAARWNEKQRQLLVDSRVTPTTLIANACAELGKHAPHLYNASAVSVYGVQSEQKGCLPPGIDEAMDVSTATDFFSASIIRQWEACCEPAIAAQVPVTYLRFGIVLDKNSGALPKMAMPFYFGLGGPVGTGQQPISWISKVDVCHGLDFLLGNPEITGPVNFVSPKCVRQIELAHVLGEVLHRPSVMPTPGFMIKWVFGQMGEELVLKGQHVVPSQLLKHGYKFHHPDIETALKAIYLQ